MMKKLSLIAGITAFSLLAVPAKAAVYNWTFSGTLSSFTPDGITELPVEGTFSGHVTFEPGTSSRKSKKSKGQVFDVSGGIGRLIDWAFRFEASGSPLLGGTAGGSFGLGDDILDDANVTMYTAGGTYSYLDLYLPGAPADQFTSIGNGDLSALIGLSSEYGGSLLGSITENTVAETPVPAAALLFAPALLGGALVARRRKANA